MARRSSNAFIYQVIVGFSISMLILIGINYRSYNSINNLKNSIDWVNHTQDVINLSDSIYALVLNAETGQRGYIISGDSTYLEPYKDAVFRIEVALIKIASVTNTNDNMVQAATIDALAKLIDKRVRKLNEVLAIYHRSGKRAAEKAIISYNGDQITNEIRWLITKIKVEEYKLLEVREEATNEQADSTKFSIILGGCISFIIIILIVWFISKTFKNKHETEKELIEISEELKAREINYRTLAKALPNTDLALFDDDLQFIIAEGFPLQTLGVSTEYLEGKFLTKEFKEAISAEDIRKFKNVLIGEEYDYEQEHNSEVYRVIIYPIKDDTGRIFSGVIISENITKRKQLQYEVENKIKELERSNENLEQFAYVASHDLQEPLRKIIAFGDRLDEDFSDKIDETGKDYIARMRNAAERMQKLINGLLTYSRVARNHNPFVKLNLNDIIDNILSDIETAIEREGAQITVDKIPEVHGDALQMNQLFQNLITNAIKFHKPGEPPVITITSKVIKGSKLKTLATRKGKNFVEIMVTDNGIGFEEKYMSQIFAIFRRLHGRNSYEGTGIGLAICKKIVDNHEGYISAESRIGEGAKFIVNLPLKN